MDIENILLNAIERKELIKFLRGEGEYMIETSQYAPGAELTDVGQILSKGIYKIYTSDNSIKQKFEQSLLQMLDSSDFDIYMVCLYLMSQLFKENNGLSPFALPKDLIMEKLTCRLNERKGNMQKGIEYPDGYVNKNALDEIQRFSRVCQDEYGIQF